MPMEGDSGTWSRLAAAAWKVRDNSYIVGTTKVGAALICKSDAIYAGCNVEHRFRSHDIHAEVNAISSMVAAGEHEFLAILVVAERERFTPCGGCMDWIMELGHSDALVAFHRDIDAPPRIWQATELMPHYPRGE